MKTLVIALALAFAVLSGAIIVSAVTSSVVAACNGCS